MKRMIALTLAAVMLIMVLPFSALAAGKMATTQENFYVVDSYSFYGYAFARIENIGDKPVEYSAGLLEIYDANGDTLASDSWLSVYGRYLQPGEYGYVQVYEKVDVENMTDVDDYMLTVTGKSSTSGTKMLRFPCTTQWLPDYQVSKYTKRNYMTAEFTNTTDQVIFDLDVVFALLDDDGNILDVESVSLYDSVGVNPGSKITVRQYVSDSLRAAYERAGFTATKVDAFAYIYVEE